MASMRTSRASSRPRIIWAVSWMIPNLFLAVPYLLRNHWILHGAPY
jgi:hypothetical protein